MKVSIDEDVCIGCGVCVSDCDTVFEIGGDGKARVIHEPGEAEEHATRKAAEDCPVNCISVS